MASKDEDSSVPPATAEAAEEDVASDPELEELLDSTCVYLIVAVVKLN